MERTPEYYLTKGLDMVVNGVAAVIFLCCLAYAGYALWDNWSILDGSENVLKTMVEYKPDEAEGLSYNFSQLMAMNPDVRVNRNQSNVSRMDILYELDGNTQGRPGGLGYDLKKAYEALSLDTQGLDRICLSCNNHGVRYRTT